MRVAKYITRVRSSQGMIVITGVPLKNARLSLSGAAVIAVLAVFSFSGDVYWNCYGDGSSNTNPPPPTRSIVSVSELSDNIQYYNENSGGGCTPDGTQSNTQPTLWAINYSDGSTGSEAILWPYNKAAGATGYLNYYVTTDSPPSVASLVSSAVRAWNSALTRDVSVNGTINITLAQSNSPSNSPITIFGNGYSGSIGLNPYEGGAEAFGSIPAPYTTLASAQIVIDPNQSSYLYAILLHEIGHSLGLDHNRDQASVMYPTVSHCFTSGVVPSSLDTGFLEGKYDPHYITPNPDSPICRPGIVCPQFVPRTTAGLQGLPVMKLPRLYASAQASTAGSGAHKAFAASSDRAPTLHVHLEDDPTSRSISLEALTLASTLVASVDVMRTVSYVKQGPTRMAIRSAKITSLLRHSLGPDEAARIGDTIYFADREFGDGESFLDDPALYPGSRAIVFLQRNDEWARRLGLRNLYRFTARSVSKLGLYGDGRLAQLASYHSRIMDEVDGRTTMDLYRRTAARYGIAALRSDESLLRAALAVRGIRSPAQVAAYRTNLSRWPQQAARWAASLEAGRLVDSRARRQ